jgi:hypothetical protein
VGQLSRCHHLLSFLPETNVEQIADDILLTNPNRIKKGFGQFPIIFLVIEDCNLIFSCYLVVVIWEF